MIRPMSALVLTVVACASPGDAIAKDRCASMLSWARTWDDSASIARDRSSPGAPLCSALLRAPINTLTGNAIISPKRKADR